MSVDAEDVRRAAKLARIAVKTEELEPLAAELNGILTWIEQLAEVDVEGVEPLTTPNVTQARQRPDLVTDGDIQEKILMNAPDSREGFFVVPKVVE
ncbi:Asp-tRNA(Asn)/Glu-tRNA(Gln) amidotransferase subunit GatC [Neomegalonema sp.]|uniref:Asp-tRNA(Asn)/Glu-tRNA(Gln) amidotransferase subunit GatC n=1 Tax=Neomegalonema sp. TaxID=2039713 RepID=UPI00261567B2|nr:Asp-tRNA(Asn)/Glu-tRNA(Gln) amidotransferase subunit GatC [Neomegalonema sp.]MDD2869954.1 Asp-tRNA(Asn)/Glu-tRNA(Gln) amidotransferase subunit GatC [Neomegalonema sp.]